MIFISCSSGIECRLRIHSPEDAALIAETNLLPRLREMKLRHTAQSEGYETMTQGSSDIVSEVKHILLFTIYIQICGIRPPFSYTLYFPCTTKCHF